MRRELTLRVEDRRLGEKAKSPAGSIQDRLLVT